MKTENQSESRRMKVSQIILYKVSHNTVSTFNILDHLPERRRNNKRYTKMKNIPNRDINRWQYSIYIITSILGFPGASQLCLTFCVTGDPPEGVIQNECKST